MTVPALRFLGIEKRYADNTVLRGVDLTVEAGEIHALLGENGAGKSTLIKVLAGVVARDAGDILIGDHPLAAAHTPDDVRRAGVAFVHQNLGLLDTLSVADNIGLVAGFPRTWRGVDRAAARAKAQTFLGFVGDVGIDPDALVGSLSQDEKVLVAIARAFALEPEVIVLDEVSASLPAPEMSRLAGVLRGASQRGVAYIYVTHRLSEVYDIADRMTVLRDGRVALTGDVRAIDHDTAVEAIVGRTMSAGDARPALPAPGPVVLEVEGLTGEGLRAPVDLEVRAGEVLGVCGLVGSGTRSLARLLGGAVRPTGGRVRLAGTPLRLGDPAALARAKVAYVPGQRGREGMLPTLTVRENLFPLRKRRAAFTAAGLLDSRREKRRAATYVDELHVRPARAEEHRIAALSGGNQQKVLLGRALGDDPRLLVLEDPTAGVDVGSRRLLHDLVRAALATGAAVLLVSTDYDEVASESHRVLVMRDGAVVSQHVGDRVTADQLAMASHGAAGSAA